MATLGMWFIGVGVANALLGGMAVRINDPMIRGLAIERFLGLPWGVWLALAASLVAFVIQDHTRLGRYIYALGGGEDLAALSGIPVDRVRIAAFTIAGRLLRRWAACWPRPSSASATRRSARAAVHHGDRGRGRRHRALGRAGRRAADAGRRPDRRGAVQRHGADGRQPLRPAACRA